MARLQDVQRDLPELWGIGYHSLNGVSQLRKWHQTKLKTGRRRQRCADPVAPAAFKQYLRAHARAAAG